MRLQLRLSLTISALIIFLSGGFMLSLYLVERSHLLAQAQAARADAVAKLATVCRDSFLSRDEIGLLNYMRQIASSAGIVSAAFIDNDGRVVMHSDVSLKGSLASLVPTSKQDAVGFRRRRVRGGSAAAEILEYFKPVDADGLRLGVAVLTYDARAADANIAKTLGEALRRLSGVALLCLAVGVIVAQYTAYVFVKPITTLTHAVGRVGEGDFSGSIVNDRGDEIGQLSRDFNSMASQLRRLDELKGQFIQSVSHDLRNPLYAIVMASEYILEKDAGQTAAGGMADTIRRSAKDLVNMVTDILDVSKMQAEKMAYRREETTVEELLFPIRDLFAPAAPAKGAALTCSVAAGLPRVDVDRRMVARVLSNLVSNAVKFCPDGGRIMIGTRPGADPAVTTFFVSDDGPGIPAENLPKLFVRFNQLARDPAATADAHGTGLGLAICKGIVEGHGGRIWAESPPGAGTTFAFNLPNARMRAENRGL